MGRDPFHQPRVPNAPSSLALSAARERAATSSLGNLGQGLTALTGKNFCLISNLNYLPSYSLKQWPRARLAFSAASALCRLMSSLSSTSTPKTFSSGLLSIPSSPSLDLCLGLPRPKCRTLHLALWNFMTFAQAHLSSLSRSLWMAFFCLESCWIELLHTPGMYWSSA